MNISEIKAAISAKVGTVIGTLSMVRQFDADPTDATKKVASPWVSHWDNDARIRITMHEDIMNQLKTNPAKSDLAIKYELVQPADKAPYHRFVVITPKDIEATF